MNDLRTGQPRETRRSTDSLESTRSTSGSDEKPKRKADEDAKQEELEACHSVVCGPSLTSRSLIVLGMQGLKDGRYEIDAREPPHIGERDGGSEYRLQCVNEGAGR